MAGAVITIAQQKGGSGKTTLAVNLAVALSRAGRSVAVLDTDPQGSLGRWFMARRDRSGEAGTGDTGIEFSTASAWGVAYECEKLKRQAEIIIIDTPPKVDADLRPALREADLVLVPVSASHVDLWATDSVLDLARREGKRTLLVLNRIKSGTRLAAEVAEAAAGMDAELAASRLSNRVVYAETLGQGRGVTEAGKGPASDEVQALVKEVLSLV